MCTYTHFTLIPHPCTPTRDHLLSFQRIRNNLLHYRHSFSSICTLLGREVAVFGCRLSSVLHPPYATSVHPNLIGFGWLVLWCELVRFFYRHFTAIHAKW